MAAAFASRRCRFDQMPRTYLVAAARGKLATSVHRPALGWCSFRLKPRTTGKPFLRFSDSNARSWEWPSVKLGVNLILSPTLKSSSIRTPCNAIPPTSITSQIRYRMRMDAYGRADHKQRWTVDPRDGGDGDIASARPHRDWARLVSRSPPLHNLSRVRRRGLFRRLVPNSPAPGHLPHLQRSGFQPSLNSDEEHAVSRTNAEPVQSNWSDQYLNLLHDSGIGHLLPALPNIARKDVRSQVFAHGSDPERNEEHLVQKQKLEFLGDSVLRLVLTRLVLEICPDLGIGPLTSIRNFLVCNAILAKISVKYKLPDQMEPQLRQCKNVQADVFESYIGGLYEDQGLECVQTWLEALFRPHVIEAYSTTTNTDANGTGSVFLTPPPDSVLSYIEQWNNRLHNSDKRVEWVYSTEHPKGSEFLVWSADVFVGDEVFGHGMGRTKTAARDAAAKEALVKMEDPV